MTNIQRAFCVVLSLIFLGVVAVLPGDFFRHGEIYRQLPLYCFLEKKALQKENGRDRETEMLLQEKNAEHLGEEVEAENRKEQETLLMAEAEEVEKKEALQKKEELQKKKEIQKKEAEEAEMAGKKSSAGKKNEKETGKEIAEPEITEPGGFLKEDLSVKKDSSVPQILIYHTHSQEAFADSREGQTEDTIVGVGDHLTELLEKTYGYQVIHITDAFDMMGGTLDRSKAYDYARASIEKVLEENPTIEVVIDLHRDGVPDERHLVTQVNGKPTAQLLFYNGLSYTVSQGAVSYLPNPYIEENLAFSFQLEYQAAQYYPDLYRGIYLAGLRYNLHLKPRALLLEAGAQTNTVEEVRNAMEPFADILNRVLKGSDKEG